MLTLLLVLSAFTTPGNVGLPPEIDPQTYSRIWTVRNDPTESDRKGIEDLTLGRIEHPTGSWKKCAIHSVLGPAPDETELRWLIERAPNGTLLGIRQFSNDDGNFWNDVRVLDDRGRIKSRRCNVGESHKSVETWAYAYDDSSRMSSIVHAQVGALWQLPSGRMDETLWFEWSASSKLLRINRQSSLQAGLGTQTFAYDRHGNLTGIVEKACDACPEETLYSAKANDRGEVVEYRTSKGLLASVTTELSGTNVRRTIETRGCGDAKRLWSETRLETVASGLLSRDLIGFECAPGHWTTTYGDAGRLLSSTSFFENSGSRSVCSYDYTFDEYGNWTERRRVLDQQSSATKSGHDRSPIVRRTISY